MNCYVVMYADSDGQSTPDRVFLNRQLAEAFLTTLNSELKAHASYYLGEQYYLLAGDIEIDMNDPPTSSSNDDPRQRNLF